MRELPEHVPYTLKRWRQRKRTECRDALAQVDRLLVGARYTPAETHVWAAQRALTRARLAMSKQCWRRGVRQVSV